MRSDDPYRSSARDDLGAVLSEHRPSALHALWMGLLVAFCVAVVIGLVLTAGRDHEALDTAKRAGMGLLFVIGAGALGHALRDQLTTRVTLGELGLRHEKRGRVVTARWGEIRSVRALRQNGSLKTITLDVGGEDLVITSGISGFADIAKALDRHRLMPGGPA